MSVHKARPFEALLLMGLLVVGAVKAVGQTQLATLVGTLTDSSGAALPRANVTVTNVRTGIENSTLTNASGDYVVPLLHAGEYKIAVELPGFKKLTKTGIVLQVAQKARVDLSLEIGEVTQEVTVEGAAPLVNTETPEVGQVITNRTVTELPLNGREFIQLVQLAPGANAGPPGAASGSSLNPGGGVVGTNPGTASLNGANDESNGYLLDGVENTDLFQHAVAIRPSIDVIQEFKVQDKLMSAEFGGTSSGIVSAITKSGSNEFRGALWEFFRNDKLDARSFFDVNKPIRRRNQFGGIFGGPITIPGVYDGRNRSFFMLNYEAVRFRSATTGFATVPTAAMKQGDFSAVIPSGQLFDPFNVDPATGLRQPFLNNRIPVGRIHPTSARLLAFFPDPNRPSTSTDPNRLANNYTKALSQRQNADQFLIRVDHNFTNNDRLFGRFAFGNDIAPTPGILPLSQSRVEAKARNFALSYTHIFNATTINEAKFAVVRRKASTGPETLSLTNFNEQFGFQSREPGVPGIGLVGLTGLGGGSLFDLPITDFNIADNLSKISGAHTFKMGFLTKRIGMNNKLADTGGGSRSFSGNLTRALGSPLNALEGRAFADFLLGTASTIGGLNIDVSADRHRPRFAFYHGYVQDDWKVSNNLTLNLGLRYDLFLPPVLTNGLGSTFFDFVTGEIVYPEDAPIPANCCAWKYRKQPGRRGTSTDYTNFGPRFGFAYRPKGGTGTVIRGGYGVYYDPGTLNVAFNNSQTPPFFKSTFATANPDETNSASFLSIIRDVAPVNQPLALPVSFKAYDRDTTTGMMQQWTLAVERELNSATVFGIAYVGWKSDHFLIDSVINFPPAGPGNPQERRPYPQFGSSVVQMGNGSGNYHGLNAKLEQRLHRGLSYLAAYTWGHSIGNHSTENGNDVWHRLQRYDNLRSERADQEYDVRQRFVFSAIYELPFGKSLRGLGRQVVNGWQVGGIYTAQGGWPLTPRVGADLLNRGGRSQLYADTNGTDPNLPKSQRSPQKWFNTAAFSIPAPFTFGNVGRHVLRTDGINNLDVSLSKNFGISETSRIQFRAEFFNLANHPTFGVPNMNVDSSAFGVVSNTINYGRQIQFALKYHF